MKFIDTWVDRITGAVSETRARQLMDAACAKCAMWGIQLNCDCCPIQDCLDEHIKTIMVINAPITNAEEPLMTFTPMTAQEVADIRKGFIVYVPKRGRKPHWAK